MTNSLNIYEMYQANGNKAGFWVKRNSWAKNIAFVLTVGGQEDGALDGLHPYFKNQKVFGEIYHEDTGRLGWLQGGSGERQEITSAGTYGYTQIATPTWWKDRPDI